MEAISAAALSLGTVIGTYSVWKEKATKERQRREIEWLMIERDQKLAILNKREIAEQKKKVANTLTILEKSGNEALAEAGKPAMTPEHTELIKLLQLSPSPDITHCPYCGAFTHWAGDLADFVCSVCNTTYERVTASSGTVATSEVDTSASKVVESIEPVFNWHELIDSEVY